jgi:hypothetical protein
MNQNRRKSGMRFNSHCTKNHTDENSTEPGKIRMKEAKYSDERATYVLSGGGGSWSIGLRAEGREGG